MVSVLSDAEEVGVMTAEPHVFSAALKLYLRELPVPVMTYELYDEFVEAGSKCVCMFTLLSIMAVVSISFYGCVI